MCDIKSLQEYGYCKGGYCNLALSDNKSFMKELSTGSWNLWAPEGCCACPMGIFMGNPPSYRWQIGVWKNTKHKSSLFNFVLIPCRVCIHVLVNKRQVKLLRKVHDGILFHSVMLFWKGPSQGKH